MAGLGLEPGHAKYTRSLIALFLIGVSTFGLMYTVQPLFPVIGADFGRNAGETSLLLAATTMGIALTVIPLGQVSGVIGRALAMRVGLALASLAGVLSTYAPTWELLIAARGMLGVGLAFIMVSAMAWAVDQSAPFAFGRIGGLYISGTTLGGVLGRLSAGFFTEMTDWRGAILISTLLALATGIVAHMLLPRTKRVVRLVRRPRGEANDPNAGFRLRMFLIGGLGMAAFVGVYNATTYRVNGEPFQLGPGFTGLLFLTYLSGTFTSAVAGRWAVRYTSRRVLAAGAGLALLGVLVTMIESIPAIIVGLLLLAAGFLGIHSVANASAAKYSTNPSASSAKYTLSYYVGSSLGGILAGVAWDVGGWPLVVVTGVVLLAGAGVAGATATPQHVER